MVDASQIGSCIWIYRSSKHYSKWFDSTNNTGSSPVLTTNIKNGPIGKGIYPLPSKQLFLVRVQIGLQKRNFLPYLSINRKNVLKSNMPRWCNGSHASLRNWYRKMCRFESDPGYELLSWGAQDRFMCVLCVPGF